MPANPQNPAPTALDLPLRMDARMLVTAAGTGVSSYAHQLKRAQEAISPDNLLLADRAAPHQPAPAPFDRAGRWVRALVPGVRPASAFLDAEGRQLLVASDVFRVAQVHFDVYRRPLAVRLPGPPGIMHWTYPVPLAAVGWRNLYTVHDVIPLLHPSLTDIDGRRYRRLLDRLAQKAARFIAVSETARGEIIDTLGVPPGFVIDCGLAVDAGVPTTAALPSGLDPAGFLLVCGTVEKRKNIGTIIAAYRASGVTMPLVIAGPDGCGAEAFSSAIRATPGAIRLPYLDRAAILALIGNARALVMPSLAEGFGMPVAEAMAAGVPVVTSDRGALAETAGGAALTVDPMDDAGLADLLRRIAMDDDLASRLADAGRRNAQRFTPTRFAERLTQAYAAVMADPA